MIVVHGKNESTRGRERRRGTALTLLFLLALPLLLATFFLAVNLATLAQARATMQNSTDAAALAAVQSLVDDSWLTCIPALQMDRIAVARNQAQFYAAANKVLGQPLTLQVPPQANSNPPDGDIIFAFLDQPRSPVPQDRILYVGDFDSTFNGNPFLPQVNTVRIDARRTQDRGNPLLLWGQSFTGYGAVDLVTQATATLDRDVVGFHPFSDQPVPMMPIALFTCQNSAMPSSWDNQLQLGNDNWQFDQTTGLFMPGSDNLPEVTMILSNDEAQASAVLLLLGIADLQSSASQNTFGGQIAIGLTDNDLQGMGGNFALGDTTNLLTVNATQGDLGFYGNLANQLNQIQGQKRIWPLYQGFDDTTGQAVIAGFVAARVVQAGVTSNGVTLVLQPSMISTRTALTNAAQRCIGGINISNPYICKVRMIE